MQYQTKHFFDVGANDGASLLAKVGNPTNIVYAFEPVPELQAKLRKLTKHFENYVVVPKAVSNFTGQAEFYISNDDNYACSSLAQFNDVSQLATFWDAKQNEYNVKAVINVNVVKLKDFMDENNIYDIEYLHVDAQGRDMEVLQGLEDYITRVKGGVIEMPVSHQRKLYEDQGYIAEDAISFLEERGFKITNKRWNDSFRNELNIYFEKLSI